MGKTIKITVFRVQKLNNAEYTNFMIRTSSLVKKATVEKLGLEEGLLEAFDKNCERMTDLGNESRKLPETAQMAGIETDRDRRLTFMFGFIDTMCSSPDESQAEAADRLKKAIESYIGIQKLPNEQETQKIRGLVLDLTKEGNAADMAKLGLTNALTQLKQVNETYEELSSKRVTAQAAATLSASKAVRLEMDEQYDEITLQAFVQSKANPTAETATFVAELNQLIANTQAAYKLRKSMAKANKDKKDDPTDPKTDDPTDPQNNG